MQIPKYIDQAIHRRSRAATEFLKNDILISEWLQKNGIKCEYTDGHIATLYEPDMVEEATREAIVLANNGKERMACSAR